MPGKGQTEENGFYESDRRNAARIENVTAWIDADYRNVDMKEEYDGKPLDASFKPIEDLFLNSRIYYALKKCGVKVIRDVFRLDMEKLKSKGLIYERDVTRLAGELKRVGLEVEWLKG